MHVRMQHIGKAFYGKAVLHDVSFDLVPGEVHVLAGENGAGKSTLVNILSGVYDVFDGTLMLDDQPVRFSSTNDARRHGIAMIHQELSLVPSLSVVDNIFLGAERGRFLLDRRRETARARTVLARLGLDLPPNQRVETLSVAVRQLIEIAKALTHDARVIIMDEPTSALGEKESEKLFQIIADLKQQQRAIVYITHRLEEVYRLADRITVLRDGRHIVTRPAADLPRHALVTHMVGRSITEQFPRRAPRLGNERLRLENVWVRDPSGRSAWRCEGISLAVHAGEILGLAGLQGSGNSDLLAAIFGSRGPLPRGHLVVDGTILHPRTPARAIRAGMALLTNDRKRDGLVLSMSIQNNITRAAFPRFSPLGWILPAREREAALREQHTLNIRLASLTQNVRELSGGNQQKVVLANWLETNPGILLLDEPTRGVDVGAKHDLYEWMNRWTAAGMAIILITSEMPELLAMADRIIVMHRGRHVAEFDRDEANQETILHAAMGETLPRRRPPAQPA